LSAQKKGKFDASFGLAEHALKIQQLGQVLLHQAASALGCSDPDDISTYNRQLLDPDTLNSAQKIFSAVSQQLASVSKLYQDIAGQHRDAEREKILIEVLKEVDEGLASRFLELYTERLSKGSLESGE
jgi:ribosomal protein L20A (L18A)